MIIRLTEDFSLIKLSAKIPTFGTNCARFKTDVSNSFSLKKKILFFETFQGTFFSLVFLLPQKCTVRHARYNFEKILEFFCISGKERKRDHRVISKLKFTFELRKNLRILSRARILEGHFWISSNKSYRSAVSAYNTWCKKKKKYSWTHGVKIFETRQDWIFISQERREEREKNWQIRSREYRSVVEFNERSFNEGSTRCCSRVTCLLALFCQEIDAPTLQRLS